ncbi:DUF2946 domain-containing protein [Caballeronia sp. LZ043]|uniref:DUF2946 domain-containing protein n=1 Tax=Caballeronia sp. LZ043 TaxID=3038569 RepID=UPI00285B7E0D|nr:DUF2946 domain-containing protein [Caballeronia sp. LZ043]MDR5825738.1 DUF2946 domain-containing protein [Caballeronia sp. LZ043]
MDWTHTALFLFVKESKERHNSGILSSWNVNVLRRRLYQRTGWLLAWFAMLLITFAPAVSQLIAARAHPVELTAELCSVHVSQASTHQHSTSSADSHFDGQACGYCQFFTHAPGIANALSAASPQRTSYGTYVVVTARADTSVARFSQAQPRAPPASI